MADSKQTRRPHAEVVAEKKLKINSAIKSHEEHITKLKQQLEDLDKPTTRGSRITVASLIKQLSKDPVTLAKVLTEAGSDESKQKELLLKALESK